MKIEKLRNDILIEITQENILYRPNFMKFFRDKLSYIIEDFKNEYKDHLNNADLSLYIKKAILRYEGTGWN